MPLDDDDDDDDDALISMARERRDAREEYRVVVVDAVVDTVVFMRVAAVRYGARPTTASLTCEFGKRASECESKQVPVPGTKYVCKRNVCESILINPQSRAFDDDEREWKERDSGNKDDVDAVHIHVRIHDDDDDDDDDDTGWICAQNQTIAQTSLTR